MSKQHNKYGCLPPQTDVRDFRLAKAAVDDSLPVAYVPMQLPKVKNQRSVSSCVAHTTSSILEFHDMQVGNNTLSTNFIYGIQKELCGHDGSGMYLRDACKIVSTYGDMLESDCSGNNEVPKAWDIAEEALKDDDAKQRAANFKVRTYFSCNSIDDIKRALYEYGPVLCSIKWYDTFKCDNNGLLTGARKGDYGYHAVMIYGWNPTGFLCQNSWGTTWGEQGRFVLPYDIPVAQAMGMVDDLPSDVIVPVRGKFIDIVYKIINWMINLLKK